MSALQISDKAAGRKIRAHKKSRRGCGSCKLRAVKCDETRPICKRCKAYGTVCNYNQISSDLELSVNGVFQVTIPNIPSVPRQKSALPKSITPSLKQGLAASLESFTLHELSYSQFELLHRFQTRTVFTVTAPRSLYAYQSSVLKYASSHPYLLHAVLTLTLLHDRHFSPTSFDTKPSATEAYHWGQTIALYSQALSSPIPPSSRDALWVTAVFLGILAMAYVEVPTPEESWPYAPPSPLDLNWLGISEGKKEIWKDGREFAEESDFRVLAQMQKGNYVSLALGTKQGLISLPPNFLEYYGFVEGSIVREDPLFSAAFMLAQSWNNSSTIILNFMFFATNMTPQYKFLLAQKDPKALLLLAYWWRMIAETKNWFLFRRASIECQSICLYLERFYGGDQELQFLLGFPRGVIFTDFLCS